MLSLMKWKRAYFLFSEVLMWLRGEEVVPDLYLRSVFEFDPSRIRGLEGILFDLEGTLANFGSTEVSPGVNEYLKGLRAQGYKMRILTNKGFDMRQGDYAGFVRQVEANSGIRMIRNRFYKPSPRVFRDAVAALGIDDPGRVAMVGDSLMTDIYGAQRANLGMTVWVDPLPGAEDWYMRWLARPSDFLYKLMVGIKHTKV